MLGSATFKQVTNQTHTYWLQMPAISKIGVVDHTLLKIYARVTLYYSSSSIFYWQPIAQSVLLIQKYCVRLTWYLDCLSNRLLIYFLVSNELAALQVYCYSPNGFTILHLRRSQHVVKLKLYKLAWLWYFLQSFSSLFSIMNNVLEHYNLSFNRYSLKSLSHPFPSFFGVMETNVSPG